MIVLMVIGHFADMLYDDFGICKSIFLFIYAFHMPVLIFISGLFYNREKTARYVLFYASCGFLLKIFITLLYAVVDKKYSISLTSDIGIPWFMFVLAIYYGVLYLFGNINKTYLLIAGLVLACFAGFDSNIGDFLYVSRAIVFFPCFMLGVVVNKDEYCQFRERHKKLLIPLSVVIIGAWLGLCIFMRDRMLILRHLLTGRNPFDEAILPYGPLLRLLCYIMAFLLCFSIIQLCPKGKIPVVTAMGKHTLNVYFWHWAFFIVMIRYCGLLGLASTGASGMVLYFVIAAALSLLLSTPVFDYPLKWVRNACFRR